MANDLTQGSIASGIARFAMPYMLSYFLQVLYGLTDLFVIGRYCDTDSTTAVANGAQVMYMLNVVFISLSMGATVNIAKAFGSHDGDAVARYVGNTLTLFSRIAILAMAVLLATRDNIISAIDTPDVAREGAAEYLTVCFIGVPFIVIYNVMASIFRGLGDTRSPLLFVAIACCANIGLDFLLIGQMGMGERGAALATTLSQAASACIATIYLRRHAGLSRLRWDMLRTDRRAVSDILRIGVPVALQDGFIQLSFMLIMVIANGRGVTDAAAVGIVEKFIGIVFIVPSAMLATVSAMAAQNIGAGRPDRAQATLKVAMRIAVGFGLVIALTVQLTPERAVGIFTLDEAVVGMGAGYLRGYVWDCVLAGVHFCFSGYFTAWGRPYLSFAHNFVAIVTARLPLAYLASELFPGTLFPMGLATVTGSLVSAVICAAAYVWLRKRGRA